MIKTIIFRKNAINKQLTQRKKERTSVKYTYIYIQNVVEELALNPFLQS